MANFDTEFCPDYNLEPPGEMLRWVLESRGIKIVDFARRCGRPTKTISEIISGKTIITPETALQFERVLNESAGYWLSLEASYQIQKARKKDASVASSERAAEWVKQFPIADMVKANFLPNKTNQAEKVEQLLRFFGVSNISAWENIWESRINLAHFKQQTHHKIDPSAVAVWLRQGEIDANNTVTSNYDEILFKNSLSRIRKLTLKSWKNSKEELKKICSEAGVALAFVPMIKKSGLRGAAYWAHKDKAVIILSDHGKSAERVWFTFFHEAAHILLHSKKAVFIDQKNDGSADNKIEEEANSFAAEYLIPSTMIDELKKLYGTKVSHVGRQEIKKFAESYEVSGGLLVERLQHEEIIPRNAKNFNTLKGKVDFSEL
jgi:HTH-type transcriptional regulator / antitoxin HigA